MAANAPYYQLRGQFTSSANAQFGADDHDYGLAASLATQNAVPFGESQAPDLQNSSLGDNHHFVELLEAATTAAGQAAAAMDGEGASAGRPALAKGKRKRQSSPAAGDSDDPSTSHAGGDGPSSHKRMRLDDPTDPQLAMRSTKVQDKTRGSQPPSNTNLLSDARAAGVHSAAALFRPSSKEPSRKYTRPPMSKLFMSLQLTPENFLHLQAQAKSYMLDPAYPERQSCVGSRGKGDTDMVKLRLFNCVRDFLNEGAGERFFGEDAEKPAESEATEAARALGEEKAPSASRLLWPRDGNKIVSLVTPLLRRMVTNERQRMYAIETRKGGAKKKEGSAEASQNGDSSHVGPAGQRPQSRGFVQEVTLAQDAISAQQSQPTTPASTIALPRFSTPVHQICPQLSVRARSLTNATNDQGRCLPTPNERTFDLRKIFVFLSKNGIKLEQMIRINLDGPVVNYPWASLLQVISNLVQAARDMYPELRPKPMRPAPAELQVALNGMGPESLRGLAIAATEMQNAASDATPLSPPSNDTGTEASKSTAQTDQELLSEHDRESSSTAAISAPIGHTKDGKPASASPSTADVPFVVKAMLTRGLTAVESAEDWKSAMEDVGYSIWAAGRLTVVVEL